MWKYILAAVVIALVWGLGLYFGIHWAIPLGVTLVVALALGGWVGYQAFRARRAARELERGLAAQALDQAKHARPDLQAETAQMQAEFQKAVQALKSSKLGRSGVDALYALPWYVIVGPPGSGKTTALRASGLDFPMTSSGAKGALRGVGGTRNCDWWLSNQGVLLDTAGRWLDAEDAQEWFSFLDLVKRSRPRKPLNGIVVAVSIADLGNAQDADITSMAKRCRDRMDEILGRLQLRLPVYVMFTKCDLMPGFVETFRDLSPTDRAQVWGFTLPLETGPSHAGQTFRARFDELGSTVERFSVKRMGEVQKIEDREQIYAFPQQFQVLRDNLATFVERAFEDNVFQETPMLRGVYFSSGTQEGRPIDRVMRRMAEALGVRADISLPSTPVDSKSYFLRDVFANVVFQDADLAARSAAEERRQTRIRWAIAASISAIALFVCSFPTYAWWQNRELLASTSGIVDAVAAARAQSASVPVSIETLEPLRERAQLFRQYAEEGPPVSMRLGMYQGDVVGPRVLELYGHTLRDEVVSPIVSTEVDRLDEFGRRMEALGDARPSSGEHSEMYDALKTYLLLTTPTEDSQPRQDAALQTWLAEALVTRWAARAAAAQGATPGPDGAPPTLPPAERARMTTHAAFYTSLLAGDPRFAFPRDPALVQRTRVALTRIPQANLVLERLISEMEPSGFGLTARSLIGPSVTAMTGRSAVRAAFTRRAWETRVRDLLSAPPETLTGEGWVLGPEAARAQADEAARDLALARLSSEYFRQYIEEWQEFVRGIRVAAPNGEVQSLTTLQDLTRGEPPPLGRLIAQVHYNLQLTYPEPPSEENPEMQGTILDVAREQIQRNRPQLARALRIADRLRAAQGQGGAQGGPIEQILVAENVAEAFHGFTVFGVSAAVAEGQTPQPTALDVYQEQLEFVRDALQTTLENPGDRDPLNARLATARVRVRALIEEQEVGWRPRFEALLWPPIDGTSLGSTRAGAMGAGRAWCSDVVQPHTRNLANRYPFRADGQDVALADFTEFFKREGTLWTYYGADLENDVERRGDGFAFTTRLGRDAGIVYVRTLPSFLQLAQDVTASYFPPGSPTPRADFDVQVHPSPEVATIELNVGGMETPIRYENGPERWERTWWPGEHPEAGAYLEVRGANGMIERIDQEGEWGLFHLLEAGTVVESDGRLFTVAFRLRTHDVEVRLTFRPVRGDNPFFGVVGRTQRPALMQPVRAPGLALPREIVVGQSLCRP
jgi:type VI secretion system protein ImpL